MFKIVPKTKKKTHKKDNTKIWDQFNNMMEIDNDKVTCIFEKIHSSENKEQNTENDSLNNCESCSSPLSYNCEGFLICTNEKCGIIRKTLDRTPEWRYYGADDNSSSDPTRCGMPINPLLQESSFGCKIVLNGRSSYEMRKIRRYTEWQSMPYHEKALYDEISRIALMAGNAGIPKLIIDDAMRYHKKISQQKTFRGYNRDGIIAASIYISCRINNNPRTAREIATMFNLDPSSATKGCKNAVFLINIIENNKKNEEKTSYCKTKPQAFIERFCSPLHINKELTKLCQFIALKIEKDNLIPENTPNSIAAGIIYFISQLCNLNISKKDVNTVTSISEVTINKCFKKLEQIQTTLIPKSIYDKYVEK
tara:strand:+ start:383 stop:1480 length:1098 start_codon:yes stop_codon:yes gene_type:complete